TRIQDGERLRITLLLIVELAEMNPDTCCQLIIHRSGKQLVKQLFCFAGHAIAGIQGTKQDLRAFRLRWQRARLQCKKDVTQCSKLLTLVIVIENLAIGRVHYRMRTVKTPVALSSDGRQAQHTCQNGRTNTHGMHYFQLLKLNTGCCAAASSSIFSWI